MIRLKCILDPSRSPSSSLKSLTWPKIKEYSNQNIPPCISKQLFIVSGWIVFLSVRCECIVQQSSFMILMVGIASMQLKFLRQTNTYKAWGLVSDASWKNKIKNKPFFIAFEFSAFPRAMHGIWIDIRLVCWSAELVKNGFWRWRWDSSTRIRTYL